MSRLPGTSRAAVLRSFRGPFSIEQVPLPPELEPGAVLARMALATICGSDVHIWQGELSRATPEVLPLILGHEMVGRVEALGPGAESDSLGRPLKPGDRIVWTHPSCGRCYECTVARELALCPNRTGTVFHPITRFPYVVGTFAEYCYISPTSGRAKVPDEVSDEEASAASCAFRSVVRVFDRLGRITPLDTVAVQGAGPLGLFSVALAAHAGAAQVIAIGAPRARLELARRFGATNTVDIDAFSTPAARVAEVKRLTGGHGPTVVVEVSGGATAFPEGIEMARRGSRYLLMGQVPVHTVTIQPSTIQSKQIDIIPSSSASTEHYYKALEFMRLNRGRFPFGDMISNRYPLDRINEAMEAMRAFREIKAAIIFP